MKKHFFLIIAIAYSLSIKAQQVALSDTVSIRLPPGTEILSKDQFSDNIISKFSYSKIALNHLPNVHESVYDKYYYKIGDVLFYMVHGKRPTNLKVPYLQDVKKEFDRMDSRLMDHSNYSAFIKSINNHDVLIVNNVYDNIGYITFLCNDRTNRFALNGELQFNLADKEKATNILNDLLKGVKFNR